MKIAIVGPVYPYRGGIAQYTARLSQAFGPDHQVQIFSFQRQYPAWLYPGRSDKDPSQKNEQIDARYTIDSLNPLTWYQTAKKIQVFQPDIVEVVVVSIEQIIICS